MSRDAAKACGCAARLATSLAAADGAAHRLLGSRRQLRPRCLPGRVLASRTEPVLPVAALRAHGDLLELRAGDLRFACEEADAFLNGRLGLDLTPENVESLAGKTEGWPAGRA